MAGTDSSRGGRSHAAALDDLATAVDDLAARPTFVLDAEAARQALLSAARLRAKVDALELALAAHAETVQVGSDSGASSAGAWWAVATRQDRHDAVGRVRLGLALGTTWQRVGESLAEGAMNLAQARVVVAALADLPGDLEPGLVARAEAHLVELAAVHPPRELRILGQRILSVVAPEVGEEHDRRRLDEAEARAAVKRRLTLSRDGDGSVHGRFTLPEVQGAMLEKILDSFAAPAHRNATHGAGSWVKGRPSAERRGEAFAELIETYPRDKVPNAGGTNGTVVVHIALADLRDPDGNPGWLETGEPISASQARRLACEARTIPVVLGGDSVVLDAGRGRRLYDHHQGVAIAARDRECRASGCKVPASRCHLHHLVAWSRGGRTDVSNAALLCPHHHARIHDPAYEARFGADNQISFYRRT